MGVSRSDQNEHPVIAGICNVERPVGIDGQTVGFTEASRGSIPRIHGSRRWLVAPVCGEGAALSEYLARRHTLWVLAYARGSAGKGTSKPRV